MECVDCLFFFFFTCFEINDTDTAPPLMSIVNVTRIMFMLPHWRSRALYTRLSDRYHFHPPILDIAHELEPSPVKFGRESAVNHWAHIDKQRFASTTMYRL